LGGGRGAEEGQRGGTERRDREEGQRRDREEVDAQFKSVCGMRREVEGG